MRIGYYKNYKAYHLNNWISRKDGVPEIFDIVVGTDDTGIFATNIFNEYANIYEYLLKSKKYDEEEIKLIIEKLVENGKRFRFTKK